MASLQAVQFSEPLRHIVHPVFNYELTPSLSLGFLLLACIASTVKVPIMQLRVPGFFTVRLHSVHVQVIEA